MRHEVIADAEDSLLLIIDVQEAMVKVVERMKPTVDRVNQLIESARILDVPIVVTEQYRKGLGTTVAQVKIDLDANRLPKAIQRLSRGVPRDVSGSGDAKSVRRHGNHVCVLQTRWISSHRLPGASVKRRDFQVQGNWEDRREPFGMGGCHTRKFQLQWRGAPIGRIQKAPAIVKKTGKERALRSRDQGERPSRPHQPGETRTVARRSPLPTSGLFASEQRPSPWTNDRVGDRVSRVPCRRRPRRRKVRGCSPMPSPRPERGSPGS